VAKKAAGTPATVLLTAEKVHHELHPYDVSPDAPHYGALVAEALGVAPEALFKTLIAEVDGRLTVAVISPLGQRKRLPTIVDDSATGLDRMYVSAGRRGLQVSLAPADLIRLTQARTAKIRT
jgi:Cys-tRNA(Pro)/Cys-tRNA(Cys) deacylase